MPGMKLKMPMAKDVVPDRDAQIRCIFV